MGFTGRPTEKEMPDGKQSLKSKRGVIRKFAFHNFLIFVESKHCFDLPLIWIKWDVLRNLVSFVQF